ncbi:MAG: hypothetical protein ACK5H4_01865 [Lacrimispora sphenoides]
MEYANAETISRFELAKGFVKCILEISEEKLRDTYIGEIQDDYGDQVGGFRLIHLYQGDKHIPFFANFFENDECKRLVIFTTLAKERVLECEYNPKNQSWFNIIDYDSTDNEKIQISDITMMAVKLKKVI